MKLNAAVLHVNTSARESNSPTMRIARYCAERLDVPLIHNVETAHRHHRKRFEFLFVKFGMLKFSQHRDHALEIYERAGQVVNLENDYTFVPDRRFLRMHKPYSLWTTVPGNALVHGGSYVNWNVLTWFPWGRVFTAPTHEHLGVLYYGAYRADREKMFEHYFRDAKYPITFSSFKGNKKFAALAPSACTRGAFRSPEEIRQYQSTLYLEDATSTRLYCSPANRFYECVQLGVPQMFDINCKFTFDRAGFDITQYMVANQKDVTVKLQHTRSMQRAQAEAWGKLDFVGQLNEQIGAAVRALR